MANREQHGNKEKKKPKKQKIKTLAAPPNQKSQTWDPNAGKEQKK